jgi:anti-anti-sigma regulatory factor
MPVTLKITDGRADVVVKGKCTVAQAAEFKDALMAAVEGARKVALDFSEATSVDLSALQLIYAVHRRAQSADVDLDFSAVTEDVVSTIEELGFQQHMPCSYDESGRCLFCQSQRDAEGR